MRLIRRMCVVGGSLAALAACDDPTGVWITREELAEARQLWNAQGVDDYRMTVRRQGGMIVGAVVVEVRDGVPVSVQPTAEFPEMPTELFRYFDTVDELFTIVERALDDNAHVLNARFDAVLGLPRNVYVDPSANVIDEEHGFVVESFQAL
jgi:hypothetical protein